MGKNRTIKNKPGYSLQETSAGKRWKKDIFSFIGNKNKKNATSEEISKEIRTNNPKRKRAGKAVMLGATAVMAATITGCSADAGATSGDFSNLCSDRVAIQECRDIMAKNGIQYVDNIENNEAIKTLDNASTIVMDKKAIAIGDEWSINVDNTPVIRMEGKAIPTLGDQYVLTDKQGNHLGSQDEDIFNIRKTSHFYDHGGKQNGTLSKKIISFLDVYELKDADGNDKARLEQNMDFNFRGEIKNSAGEVEYTFDKKILSVGANITIEKKVNDPSIDELDVIKMVSVANEIKEGKNNGNSQGKK